MALPAGSVRGYTGVGVPLGPGGQPLSTQLDARGGGGGVAERISRKKYRMGGMGRREEGQTPLDLILSFNLPYEPAQTPGSLILCVSSGYQKA